VPRFKLLAPAFALALVCSVSLATEPVGLRDAMAKWDLAQNAKAVQLYGATPVVVDPNAYQFKYALVDLDGDGILDAVVYLTGARWCGSGGCTLRILKGTKTGFSFVSGTLRTFCPVLALDSQSHGWKSLAIALRAGGFSVLEFDGKHYPLSPDDERRASSSQLRGAKRLIDR
jgi:hypothetical protein